MLKSFDSYRNIYIEITKSDHEHGGKGWEFGSCLWSPSRNKAGIDRYALMREPQANDLILHFYKNLWDDRPLENRLCGRSFVSRACYIDEQGPPLPGQWKDYDSYYRIDLHDFELFEDGVPISTFLKHYASEIRRDMSENKIRYYPFATYGDGIQTVQGIYLAKCTPGLYSIFLKALRIQESLANVHELQDMPHIEYTESKRKSAEQYFFSRNSTLARDAKKHYGYICQICNFDFERVYGEHGRGYIELHHLNPLSEREEFESGGEIKTTISDVTVLCANCHRMIHRSTPALTLEELRNIIETTRNKWDK